MRQLPHARNSNERTEGWPGVLLACLENRPGDIGRRGLRGDTGHQVTFAIDAALWNAEYITCHPMVNTCTVSMAMADMKAALAHMGVQPVVLSLEPESVGE